MSTSTTGTSYRLGDPDPTTGPGAWHLEAEAHLRQAGRALEMLGLVDQESARMALIVYRLASRVRSERIAR